MSAATTFYGLTLLTASVLVSVLWRYAVRERLVHPDAHDDEVAAISKRLAPGLGFYVVMIGLGLFFPVVAVLGYLAIAIFYLVPIHSLRHRHRS